MKFFNRENLEKIQNLVLKFGKVVKENQHEHPVIMISALKVLLAKSVAVMVKDDGIDIFLEDLKIKILDAKELLKTIIEEQEND